MLGATHDLCGLYVNEPLRVRRRTNLHRHLQYLHHRAGVDQRPAWQDEDLFLWRVHVGAGESTRGSLLLLLGKTVLIGHLEEVAMQGACIELFLVIIVIVLIQIALLPLDLGVVHAVVDIHLVIIVIVLIQIALLPLHLGVVNAVVDIQIVLLPLGLGSQMRVRQRSLLRRRSKGT